jgi:hypothetical protein
MAVEAIPDFVMCVTDLVSEQLAELRLTTGEGPCHDVLVVLADPRGELRVAAGLQRGRPGWWSCSSCRTIRDPAWTASALAGPSRLPTWPTRTSARAGFRAVEALPVRLRDQVIGALNHDAA